MQYKNRYLYYSILPFCLLLIAIAIYVSGYNPPTQGPPFGNLPAPINAGTDDQRKEGGLTIGGNLIAEGVLRLGQFDTTNAPSGTEGGLYYDTTKKSIQVYVSNVWKDLCATKAAVGKICKSDDGCDSGYCIDGVCCVSTCEGNCNRCNVADFIGTCTEVPSDCTGDCDVCSLGNCIADPTKCTGNCVQCTGSGAEYSCSANNASCTGDCSFCTGADTEYNCAGSNGFCSNTISSCSCSGSGTVWNCQACTDDPYGVCGHPTCSSYSCGSAYDNGVYCAYNGRDNNATNYYCSSGSCLCTSSSGTSSRDGKDNDCDGTVDECAATGTRNTGYSSASCHCDTCDYSVSTGGCVGGPPTMCNGYCGASGCLSRGCGGYEGCGSSTSGCQETYCKTYN